MPTPSSYADAAEGPKPEPIVSDQAEPVATGGPGRSLLPLLTAIAAVAALYFGREIFVPLALAMLFTFALSPVVSYLRRWRVPRIPAVVLAVTGALLGLALFGAVVTAQLATLAENLPSYQQNITAKIRSFRNATQGEDFIERASRMLETLGREVEEAVEEQQEEELLPDPAAGPQDAADQAAEEEEAEPEPIPVLVTEPALGPRQILRTLVVPLIEPIATAGIVIVFVIFMLIRREDLRDRFIRLVGAHDIHRTTTALQDAGRRVGQYLLMQLVVNVTYAIPVGIGLWLIGVPNALLWSLLALVLRFIPYVGPVIAAFFPLALSIAVAPGWSMLLWTGALFIVIELISNNFVEPYLYGSRTGLSPVAIIMAAIFWTWLWGPVGLLLSTPLTVCLAVLGRHVPQFRYLDVLLGNEPVLSPPEQFYQRLLAGDPDEATDRAEEYLREGPLAAFYQEVALPALDLAEDDRARGVLSEKRRERVARGALALIDNLAEHEDVELEADAAEEMSGFAISRVSGKLFDGVPDVICAGGRGNLDDAGVAMLADVLERAGATVRTISHEELATGKTTRLDLFGRDLVFIGYLNESSAIHARYVVRRLRRLKHEARIVVAFWSHVGDDAAMEELKDKVRSDYVIGSIGEAIAIAQSVAEERKAEAGAVEAEKQPRRRRRPAAT